jgi:drug/metabolite transporter (DMT)-like permease
MNRESKALGELILATFLFSLFGVFTRLIADSVGVFYQLILRVGIMSVLFYIILILSKKVRKVEKNDIFLFLFRGLLVVVDFACFFIAINNLPMGLTLFIFYAASVVVSYVFGAFFLGEKLNSIKIISLSLAIFGLFVMYSESFSGISLLPSIAALVSGCCFGLNTTSSKKLTDKYDSTQVNLIAYVMAFVLTIPLIAFFKEQAPSSMSLITALELLGFSVIGVGAFYLTLNGYKYIEAQKASLIMLAELIFVILLGLIVYAEVPTVTTLVGGVLIVLALALPNIKSRAQIKI